MATVGCPEGDGEWRLERELGEKRERESENGKRSNPVKCWIW
jgi:hypothetical protein